MSAMPTNEPPPAESLGPAIVLLRAGREVDESFVTASRFAETALSLTW